MKFRLIYPRWKKLERQTEFHLPPHGPVVFAATLPPDVEVEFIDENVEAIAFDEPRRFRRHLHDADQPGEAGLGDRGRLPQPGHQGDLRRDRDDAPCRGDHGARRRRLPRRGGGADGGRSSRTCATGRLKPVYDYFADRPPIEIIGPARRVILKRDLYNYKGIQMVDLVHASRGCRFNCYPCCVSYLGGRQFRPRPVERVIAEMAGDRQQPPVHRGQLAGPGPPVGDRTLPRDDPAEEEVVLPSHRGGRRGPGPGRPGRGLVRLPGRLRHLGPHPRADQALSRPRHRRGGDGPAGAGRPDRGRHQAADRFPAGDRAGSGRVHRAHALSPYPDLRGSSSGKSGS